MPFIRLKNFSFFSLLNVCLFLSWIEVGFHVTGLDFLLVGKMMSLLFNTLSRFVIAFLKGVSITSFNSVFESGYWNLHFSSVAQLCLILWDPMDCSTPGLPVHHQLPEFTQTHVHWVSDAVQPSHPLSSPSSLAFSLSQHQGLFQWVSSLHQVARVLEFELYHQSFQWIFRTDFLYDGLDLLAVQGTLRSLLQHHSSKASILHCSAFFMVQFSHPYMTIGKTIALTRWTFVGKVTSLLFNILSRLVIAFLPRSKSHLISWLQSPSAVILEPKKRKSVTISIVSHLFALKWWDRMPWS